MSRDAIAAVRDRMKHPFLFPLWLSAVLWNWRFGYVLVANVANVGKPSETEAIMQVAYRQLDCWSVFVPVLVAAAYSFGLPWLTAMIRAREVVAKRVGMQLSEAWAGASPTRAELFARNAALEEVLIEAWRFGAPIGQSALHKNVYTPGLVRGGFAFTKNDRVAYPLKGPLSDGLVPLGVHTADEDTGIALVVTPGGFIPWPERLDEVGTIALMKDGRVRNILFTEEEQALRAASRLGQLGGGADVEVPRAAFIRCVDRGWGRLVADFSELNFWNGAIHPRPIPRDSGVPSKGSALLTSPEQEGRSDGDLE